MPANLTPEYYKAEEKLKKAQTSQEKLVALKHMLATIPKHKGTEKLQGDIKRRIAKLKEEIQQQAKKKGFAIHVEKEGAAQLTVVGPPNSGKSRLVSILTNVHVEVGEYPYTTQKPFSAMMSFEDIQIQLVDLPPISSAHIDFWIPNIIRNSDAIVMVFDLSLDDLLDQIEVTISILEDNKIKPVGYDVEYDPWASTVEKKAWMVGNKFDLSVAKQNWGIMKEFYFKRFGISAVSAQTGDNVERLRVEIFQMLKLLRVYSKRPHQEADLTKPFVLKQGSTLLDFAKSVHLDFGDRMKFARIWGKGKFDGQRVNKDYLLQDKDIIELHI